MGLIVAAAILGIVGVVAIIATTTLKIAKVRAAQELPSGDLAARVEALEGSVSGLQAQLTETQERLDFAERMLAEGRPERRIGS